MAFKKWMVVSGSHRQSGKSYKKGSKFVTNHDMSKYNTLPHAPKYKLIGDATEEEILQYQAEVGYDDTPPSHVDEEEQSQVDAEAAKTENPTDSLEAMTIQELKSLAADEEIDIHGANTKAAIVAKIRDARAE